MASYDLRNDVKYAVRLHNKMPLPWILDPGCVTGSWILDPGFTANYYINANMNSIRSTSKVCPYGPGLAWTVSVYIQGETGLEL